MPKYDIIISHTITSTLYFEPGHNYTHYDITIHFTTTNTLSI